MRQVERSLSDQQTKALNVVLPDDVYWHLRKCAIQSRMSLKEFMIQFCRRAEPIPLLDDSDKSDQGKVT